MKHQVTVEGNGPITIPNAIRWATGIVPDVCVAVEVQGDDIVIRRAEFAESIVDKTAGILGAYRLERPLTPQEEKDAAAQAIAEEVVAQMNTRE